MQISFTHAAFRHRLLQGGGRGQALAKALGLAKGRCPEIVDATAGLGRDGFILAHLGAPITLIERSPEIARALQRALEEARVSEPLFAEPANRIKLIAADAKDVLPDLLPKTVYIDPMHPARNKSALVKKNLRDLREIVGTDHDSAELIQVALDTASKRVVVKWPRKTSLPEAVPRASHVLAGKTISYHIFVI
jgi:16S rRNA (guanine1516-N2)-methyltransferase